MKRACYRRISGKENLFLGLELADLVFLQLALMLMLLLTGSLLLTIPAVVLFFFLIRSFKKNRPRHYTDRLIRFLARPRYFNLYAIDGEEVIET